MDHVLLRFSIPLDVYSAIELPGNAGAIEQILAAGVEEAINDCKERFINDLAYVLDRMDGIAVIHLQLTITEIREHVILYYNS